MKMDLIILNLENFIEKNEKIKDIYFNYETN